MANLSLRPCTAFVSASRRDADAIDKELWNTFVFSAQPLICRAFTPPPSDIDSGDETDEYDHEERIRSSWHHRALIGDEDRVMYTDHKDTEDVVSEGEDGTDDEI